MAAHEHDRIRRVGEHHRIDEVHDLGPVVAPRRRIEDHAVFGADAERPARLGGIAGCEHIVARIALDPHRSGEECVRLAEDAGGVGILSEEDVPPPRLSGDRRHASRLEARAVQCETLERRAVPGLQDDLALPALEAATQPVVDDEQSGRSARAPPVGAAFDDRDRAVRDAHREIDDAPVARDVRSAARELAVDRQRVAARIPAIEALEEHRVLEALGPGGVAALERRLTLAGVVGGVDRRTDPDRAGVERCTQRAELDERQGIGRLDWLGPRGRLDHQRVVARRERQFGAAPSRGTQRQDRLPGGAVAVDLGRGARARTHQPDRRRLRAVAVQNQRSARVAREVRVGHPVPS